MNKLNILLWILLIITAIVAFVFFTMLTNQSNEEKDILCKSIGGKMELSSCYVVSGDKIVESYDFKRIDGELKLIK